MLKQNKLVIILIFWLIVVISMTVGSLLPQAAIPANHPFDKIVHFLAYSFASFIPGATFPKKKNIILAAIFLLLLGTSIEITQYFIPGRSASYFDGIVNAIGIISGTTVGIIARKLIRRFLHF